MAVSEMAGNRSVRQEESLESWITAAASSSRVCGGRESGPTDDGRESASLTK